MANHSLKKFTRAQLAALELPEPARRVCQCKRAPTHTADGNHFWGRACEHRENWAPPGWTQQQWFMLFESMFGPMNDEHSAAFLSSWAQALIETFGEDYEDRAELDEPWVCLTRKDRIPVLRERQRKGKSLWNDADVFGLAGGGVEARGKKNQDDGDLIHKGVRHESS